MAETHMQVSIIIINHSHRKSAEKVTWQITQIGNSAGCLSWQWLIRKIKDDWKVILTFSLFAFSNASMFYLELQGLAGGEKGIRSREVRTGGMKCQKNVSQCLSFSFSRFILSTVQIVNYRPRCLWNGVDWMVIFCFPFF